MQFICPSAVDSVISDSVPIANPGEIESYVDYTGYTNTFDTVHPSKPNRYILYYIHFQLQLLLQNYPPKERNRFQDEWKREESLDVISAFAHIHRIEVLQPICTFTYSKDILRMVKDQAHALRF